MCIIYTKSDIDLIKAAKAQFFIGTNLLDFEIFKPLVDMVLKDRYEGLERYCNRMGKPYDKMLRKRCEINLYDFGTHLIIAPHFITKYDAVNNTDYYVLWDELVGKAIAGSQG